MATLNVYWEMIYSSSRRAHSHRCMACNKIVKAGELVKMARVRGGKTRVLHAECTDKPFGDSKYTQLEALECWGYEYLSACGSKSAREWLDKATINKVQ